MKTSQRDELQGRRSTGMRSKLNLTGATDQRIGQKLRMATMPLGRVRMSAVPVSRMPMEWMDAGSWRLPSGKALAEFALQAGFLAPLLLKADRFGTAVCASESRQPMHGALSSRAKHFGKGGTE
jgi:hypothetical protein